MASAHKRKASDDCEYCYLSMARGKKAKKAPPSEFKTAVVESVSTVFTSVCDDPGAESFVDLPGPSPHELMRSLQRDLSVFNAGLISPTMRPDGVVLPRSTSNWPPPQSGGVHSASFTMQFPVPDKRIFLLDVVFSAESRICIPIACRPRFPLEQPSEYIIYCSSPCFRFDCPDGKHWAMLHHGDVTGSVGCQIGADEVKGRTGSVSRFVKYHMVLAPILPGMTNVRAIVKVHGPGDPAQWKVECFFRDHVTHGVSRDIAPGVIVEREGGQDSPLVPTPDRLALDTRPRAHPKLMGWFKDNIRDPFPSKAVKAQLAMEADMTVKQVTAWFSNTRFRLWKRLAPTLDVQAIRAQHRPDR